MAPPSGVTAERNNVWKPKPLALASLKRKVVAFFILSILEAVDVVQCISVVSRTHILSCKLQELFIPDNSIIPKNT